MHATGGTVSESLVVGVDGSTQSLAAVKWAATEASIRQVRLLVCCVSVEDVQHRATLWAGPQLVRRDAADVAATAVDAARATAPGVDVSSQVVLGEVVPELRAAAADAQLLVLGCRGLGAFSGLLLGSVSERLARRPDRPVVVVRGEPAGWDRPVLVGVDDAPETTAAIEFAAAEAERRGVGLAALTAVPPIWPAPPVAVPIESETGRGGMATLVRQLQDDALAVALDRHPAVAVDHRVLLHGAASALIEASAGCGLVVVGAGTGPLGSVAGHVLRHAACPVAVVPAD